MTKTFPISFLTPNTFFEGADDPKPEPVAQPKTFSQEQVNKIIADRLVQERNQWQKGNEDTIKKLQELQNQQSTTEEQRATLQTQIDNLTTQFQSKEQQLQRTAQSLEKKYQDDTKVLQSEISGWKSRYEQNLTRVDISNAAAKYKAFNPQQVEAILAPMTKVTEQLGEDGKLTGIHVPMVDFTGKDNEGKPIKLKLSVDQAVKAMTEMPDLYGNLFRSEANGGLGGTTTGGRGSPTAFTAADIENMSMEQYVAHKEKILKQAQ